MKTTMDSSHPSAGDTAKTLGAPTVRDHVLELVKLHGVSCEPGPLDAWASAVTRLSGDDVEEDDVFRMILALERADVLSTTEADQLHIQHLRERVA